MPQTTILASGQTAASSSTQTIASGAVHTVGLFTSNAAGIPPQVGIRIDAVTPGNPRRITNIVGSGQPIQLQGPLQYTVSRVDIAEHGVNVGVWQES